MLTIAFVLSSYALLSAALPVDQVLQEAQGAAGTGTTVVLSKRGLTTGGGGIVNTTAINRHRDFRTAKIQNGFAYYERNTGTVHSLAKGSTLSKRGAGSNPLQNDHSDMWHGQIAIGTPPQNFTVDFDTGSSDLFVANMWCNVNCDGHTVYHAEGSHTAHALFKPFKLEYGDGSSVMGLQYAETVTVANMTAVNQTIGSAFLYSDGFAMEEFPPDGLMGMAFPTISSFNATPLFQNLIAQNKTDDAVFSFKLAQNGSELFIGGANNASYKGNFTYVNVTHQGYWQIDTGTTLVIGNSTVVKNLYAAIPGAKEATDAGPGLYSVPCNALPNVSMTFGGKQFNLSHETFSMGLTSANSTDCIGGIVGSQNADQDFWIVGDVFLQNVYSTFDVGRSRVGFADLA